MIFALINFVILIVFLYIVIRPAAVNFFYARNQDIKKKITAAAEGMHAANLRLKKAEKALKDIPAEIEARKADMNSLCERECRDIIFEAKRAGEHLLRVADEQIRNDEKMATSAVRKEMLSEAIESASKRLMRPGDGEFHKKLFGEGVDDVRSAISS